MAVERHAEIGNCAYEVASHSCASPACHNPTQPAASGKTMHFYRKGH